MRLMHSTAGVHTPFRSRLCRLLVAACAIAVASASCAPDAPDSGDGESVEASATIRNLATAGDEQAEARGNAAAERFLDLDGGLWYPHMCGVRVDGSLVCWGINDGGQSEPPAGTFSSVSVGDQHACAIDAEERILRWRTSPIYRVGYTAPGEPPSGSFTATSVGNGVACAEGQVGRSPNRSRSASAMFL